MAQKMITRYIDDLTGEESAEISTYTILINGAGVEIDLTPESHDQLMDALRPFLHADGARRVRTAFNGSLRRGHRTAAINPDTAAISLWAKENGFPIRDRGRIPASVSSAYYKAR
jgi:hypothetical protein